MAAQCSAAIIMLTALITKETIWDKSCQGRPKWPRKKNKQEKKSKSVRDKVEVSEYPIAVVLNWKTLKCKRQSCSIGDQCPQVNTWSNSALGMIQLDVKRKLE